MTQTRRTFLVRAASAGSMTILPFAARAQEGASDVYETPAGPITIHPISHASVVMETPAGVIYVDPVGSTDQYERLPAPDLILVTHEHGDHFDPELLTELMASQPSIVVNPAVAQMLPSGMEPEVLANGETLDWADITIEAVPAYNITEGRLDYHPEGRDNGYVLGFEGFRVYVSGDTEDIPEMRALENIDVAFVSMVLPYTMDASQAASAVQEFQPVHVYPYHYQAGGEGDQDPQEFAEMVGDAAEVRFGEWYE